MKCGDSGETRIGARTFEIQNMTNTIYEYKIIERIMGIERSIGIETILYYSYIYPYSLVGLEIDGTRVNLIGKQRTQRGSAWVHEGSAYNHF